MCQVSRRSVENATVALLTETDRQTDRQTDRNSPLPWYSTGQIKIGDEKMNGGTFPQSNYWWHVPLRLRVHSAGFIFWRKRSVWFARVFSWTITSWACASNRNRLWNELDDWMNHLRYEIYDNYATILRSPRVSLFPRLQLSQAASATYSICPHAVSVCLSRSCIVSKCVKLMLRLWIWSFTVWLFCLLPKSNLSETF